MHTCTFSFLFTCSTVWHCPLVPLSDRQCNLPSVIPVTAPNLCSSPISFWWFHDFTGYTMGSEWRCHYQTTLHCKNELKGAPFFFLAHYNSCAYTQHARVLVYVVCMRSCGNLCAKRKLPLMHHQQGHINGLETLLQNKTSLQLKATYKTGTSFWHVNECPKL